MHFLPRPPARRDVHPTQDRLKVRGFAIVSRLTAALGLCLPALATDPGSELQTRVERETNGMLELHFEIRSRAEFRNAQEFGLGEPLHGDFIRTRVGVDFRPANWVRFSALGQDARAPFLGRPAPGSMRDPFDLQEAYVEFLGESKRGFTADIGRRMVQYGDTRLIGAPQWAYTARTYDLARAAWKTAKNRFEVLLISPIKPNGQAFNRPVLGDRVWGTYNTFVDLPGKVALDLYALRHDQNRPGGFTEPGRLATDSFGFRVAIPLVSDNRFTAEAILQRGEIGALPHRAHAWALQWARKDAVFGKPLDTAFEYKFASGTERADRSGTFDQLYPAAHDKLGHADLFGWRNVRNLKITSSLGVIKGLSVTAMYSDSWLAVATDAAYNAQGRPIARSAAGTAGTHLGREADLFGQYKRGNVTFGGGVGYFFTGRFLRATTPGLHQHLFYVFQTYGF